MIKPHILIIDDEEPIGKMLQIDLMDMGYRPYYRPTFTGLEEIEDIGPNIILLDYDLNNGMDGAEIAKQIRENPQTKNTPIIMMTGEISEEEIREKTMGAANDILAKPFTERELKEKLPKYDNVSLNIGVTGLGDFGVEVVKRLQEEPWVRSINLHSDYYARVGWDEFFKFTGIQSRKNTNTFDSLEQMFSEGPVIDAFQISGSKKGEAMAPRPKKLRGTMGVIGKRLPIILEAMRLGKIDFLLPQSGPQDMLHEYLRRQFPELMYRINGVSPDPIRGKYLLKEELEAKAQESGQESEVKDLNNIYLVTTGGRPGIHLLSSCTINGSPLFDVHPEYRDPEKRRQFQEEANRRGDEEVRAAKKHGQKYTNAQREVRDLLYDFSQLKSIPSHQMYAWNPKYRIYMQGFANIVYGQTSATTWRQSVMPKMDEFDAEQVEKWQKEQKEMNDKNYKTFEKAIGKAA